MMNRANHPGQAGGFGMIEVMVALLVIMIALLGLVGLQGRALTAQIEAYQRAQAIVLAKDMMARIRANRIAAATYATAVLNPPYLGTNSLSTINCVGLAGQALDWCEWNRLLQGAAEAAGANQVGAMEGARGCIVYNAGPPEQVLVTVVWQGLAPTAASTNTCGLGLYGTDDAFRRVITIPVSIADLSA